MTIYYYNHSQGDKKIAIFFNAINSKCITDKDCQYLPEFVGGDVVFVHPGDDEETGPGKQWWVALACKNLVVHFVFVSTKPTDIGPGRTDSANIHYCKYAAHTFSDQPRVQKFFKKLRETDEKEWDLLVPPPFPEYLLAAYLVQAAAKNGVPVNPEESGCANFWNKAREEFDQRAAQEGEVPEFTPNGDPSKLKSLLESIARGS